MSLRRTCRFALILALFTLSCGDRRVAASARTFGPVLAERMPSTPPGRLDDTKRRFREAVTYVDGRLAGALRRCELPLTLKPRKQKLSDGRLVDRFAYADYLQALGVDLDHVRAVHVHGGRGRVAVVPGDLVRKFKDEFFFSFTRGDRGKPRGHWPSGDFRINTTIDVIEAIAVYVDKPPPEWDPQTRSLRLDGKKPEGIAYAPAEELKGTRVYADGALATAMKRKQLPDKLLVPGTPAKSPHFSLVAWLESVGVDVAAVRSAEFFVGDDLVARASAPQWAAQRQSLEFSIPRRSQGKLMMHFPAAAVARAPDDAGEPQAKVSSIQLFLKATPPPRELAPIPDQARDEGPPDAAGSARRGGSRAAQADDGNAAESE